MGMKLFTTSHDHNVNIKGLEHLAQAGHSLWKATVEVTQIAGIVHKICSLGLTGLMIIQATMAMTFNQLLNIFKVIRGIVGLIVITVWFIASLFVFKIPTCTTTKCLWSFYSNALSYPGFIALVFVPPVLLLSHITGTGVEKNSWSYLVGFSTTILSVAISMSFAAAKNFYGLILSCIFGCFSVIVSTVSGRQQLAMYSHYLKTIITRRKIWHVTALLCGLICLAAYIKKVGAYKRNLHYDYIASYGGALLAALLHSEYFQSNYVIKPNWKELLFPFALLLQPSLPVYSFILSKVILTILPYALSKHIIPGRCAAWITMITVLVISFVCLMYSLYQLPSPTLSKTNNSWEVTLYCIVVYAGGHLCSLYIQQNARTTELLVVGLCVSGVFFLYCLIVG